MRVVLLAAALWASMASAQQPGSPVNSSSPALEPFPADVPQADSAKSDSAKSDSAASPGPTAVDAARPADYPRLGLMLAAGVPDGAGLSFVYRPFTWLRANAGVSYNLFGFGVHGGVTLAPFYFFITPTLTLEGGHFLESDASSFAGRVLPNTDFSQAGDALKHLSYDYASGQVGVELGSPRNFVFFLRAGLSYLQSTINLEKVLQNAVGDTSLTADPLKVRATFPSLKLGFNLYF